MDSCNFNCLRILQDGDTKSFVCLYCAPDVKALTLHDLMDAKLPHVARNAIDMARHYMVAHCESTLECTLCKVKMHGSSAEIRKHINTDLHKTFLEQPEFSSEYYELLNHFGAYQCLQCVVRGSNAMDAERHQEGHVLRAALVLEELAATMNTLNIQLFNKQEVAKPTLEETERCRLCDGKIDNPHVYDRTRCCHAPVHFGCAVIFGISKLASEKHEQCLLCKAPNSLELRLRSLHTEFRWPFTLTGMLPNTMYEDGNGYLLPRSVNITDGSLLKLLTLEDYDLSCNF